jgi:hypothetical protein
MDWLPRRPLTKLVASPAMRAAAQRARLAKTAAPKPVKPEPSPGEIAVPVEAEVATSRRRWYPRHRRRTYDAALDALLREVFPEVFRVPRPPLAIGIHREILEVAGAEVSRQQLGWVLA